MSDKPDDEFDDLDFDDEFDAAWDDDDISLEDGVDLDSSSFEKDITAEENNIIADEEQRLKKEIDSKPSSGPKLIKILLGSVGLSVLGFGGFIAYSNIPSQPPIPPVVEITESVQEAEINDTVIDLDDQDLIVSDENDMDMTVEPDMPVLDSPSPEISTDNSPAGSNEGVLTPFPSDLSNISIELEDLGASDENNRAPIQNHNTSDRVNDVQTLFMAQENTDVSFEAPDTVTEEDIATDENLSPQPVLLNEDILIEKTEQSPEPSDLTSSDEEIDAFIDLSKLEEEITPPLDLDTQHENVIDEPITNNEMAIKEESVVANADPVEQDVKTENNSQVTEDPQIQKVTPPAPRSKPKTDEPAKPKAVSRTWVIKAAQPGKAIIRDSKSGLTKAVEVGHTVSGIGKIIKIDKINGKWVIVGRNGKISQ